MDFFGFDLAVLVKTVGILGLFGIVFAESGLLVGFFLPGDSLLFTAGFLASQGFLDIRLLMAVCFAGAVLGDSFGYGFGYRVGPKIFTREDSVLFHKKHLERAAFFYERYGPAAIVLARFMPIIRTFAPILAGVGKMRYRTFLSYNLIGGFLWGIGMPLLGYFLGSVIPDPDRYLIPLVIAIIILSFLPPVIHVLRRKDERERIWAYVKEKFSRSVEDL